MKKAHCIAFGIIGTLATIGNLFFAIKEKNNDAIVAWSILVVIVPAYWSMLYHTEYYKKVS